MGTAADTVDAPSAASAAAGAAVDDEPPLLPGSSLGSYRILSTLGEGGMGRVYLAEHSVIKRRVALKVLRRALADSQRAVDRFFAEAQAVNRIRHSAIVEVTDLFVADGTPCIVMELLEGHTLSSEIAEGILAPERVVAVGRAVADALAATHAAGVVHRDLKPDNIFILDKPELTLKVLDFGVAKLVETAPTSSGQTAAGAIIGTPEYMAPEQLAGRAVDGRADIYTLGVTLFHATAGHVPFEGESFGDYVVKHLTQPVPRLCAPRTNVPPGLERAILAMLEKDPDRRPRTMHDVDALLAEALTWRPSRRPPLALVGAAAAALVAVAGGAWAVLALSTDDVAPAVVVEAPPVVEIGPPAPVVEAAPLVEAAPVVDAAPAVEAAPVVETQPVVAAPAPPKKTKKANAVDAKPVVPPAAAKPEPKAAAKRAVLDPFAEGG